MMNAQLVFFMVFDSWINQGWETFGGMSGKGKSARIVAGNVPIAKPTAKWGPPSVRCKNRFKQINLVPGPAGSVACAEASVQAGSWKDRHGCRC